MKEKWKDIEGFDNYRISNLGRVQSCKKIIGCDDKVIGFTDVKLLKPWDDGRGYRKVSLFNNKKRKDIRVHILVAKAFIPNPNNYPIINHKDENPSNNRVDNLEWCTNKYNSNYGTGKTRCANSHKKPIVSIDIKGNKTYYDSAKDAAIILKTNATSITAAARGKQQTSCGLRWEYV